MDDRTPDISFVILSWNSGRYLARCLESLVVRCSGEGIAFEAIVIDNGSSDDSVAIVETFVAREPDSFALILLERNGGTTYPRNLGLRRCRGRFICVLDSDTELLGGSLAAALDIACRQGVGIVAPKLILPDGSVQNSVKRFPTFVQKLRKIPQILFGIATANSDFYADFPFTEEREVDSAISACWIFRRELLDTVGYLDERIFYAPEDLDFCLRVRKRSYSIVYYPGFEVLHLTQQITHRRPFSRTSRSHFGGLLYYYCKHGGWLARPQIDGAPR